MESFTHWPKDIVMFVELELVECIMYFTIVFWRCISVTLFCLILKILNFERDISL